MKNPWLDRKKAREAEINKKRIEERWKRLEFLYGAHFNYNNTQLPLHYKIQIKNGVEVFVPFTNARYMLKFENQISINFPDASDFPMEAFSWLADHGWQGGTEVLDAVIKVYAGKYHLKTEMVQLRLVSIRFGDINFTEAVELDLSLDFDIVG